MQSIEFLNKQNFFLFSPNLNYNSLFAQLVNKKKASKKKPPTPLTADMLNELNKNHMGGLENYAAEDLYNLDDTWDERRQEAKPKVKVSFIFAAEKKEVKSRKLL